jgi:hypothetical protein
MRAVVPPVSLLLARFELFSTVSLYFCHIGSKFGWAFGDLTALFRDSFKAVVNIAEPLFGHGSSSLAIAHQQSDSFYRSAIDAAVEGMTAQCHLRAMAEARPHAKVGTHTVRLNVSYDLVKETIGWVCLLVCVGYGGVAGAVSCFTLLGPGAV